MSVMTRAMSFGSCSAVVASLFAGEARGQTFTVLSGFAPFSVSDNGGVLAGSGVTGRATYWTPQGLVEIGSEQGFGVNSGTSAVSGDGRVLTGKNFVTSGGRDNVYRWTGPGTYESLGGLSAYERNFVSDADQTGSTIVGYSDASMGRTAMAWVWTRDAGLRAIGYTRGGAAGYSRANGVTADGGMVVGFSGGTQVTDAFVWTPTGGMTRLTPPVGQGTVNAEAYGVSSNGSIIVGNWYTSTIPMTACVWRDGIASSLGMPEGYGLSYATSVSDNGVIVGLADRGSRFEAFVWASGAGPVPMADYLRSFGVDLAAGTVIGDARVSANGLVFTGFAVGRGWFVATLPAPSAVFTLGLGLFVFGSHRRPR